MKAIFYQIDGHSVIECSYNPRLLYLRNIIDEHSINLLVIF